MGADNLLIANISVLIYRQPFLIANTDTVDTAKYCRFADIVATDTSIGPSLFYYTVNIMDSSRFINLNQWLIILDQNVLMTKDYPLMDDERGYSPDSWF